MKIGSTYHHHRPVSAHRSNAWFGHAGIQVLPTNRPAVRGQADVPADAVVHLVSLSRPGQDCKNQSFIGCCFGSKVCPSPTCDTALPGHHNQRQLLPLLSGSVDRWKLIDISRPASQGSRSPRSGAFLPLTPAGTKSFDIARKSYQQIAWQMGVDPRRWSYIWAVGKTPPSIENGLRLGRRGFYSPFVCVTDKTT